MNWEKFRAPGSPKRPEPKRAPVRRFRRSAALLAAAAAAVAIVLALVVLLHRSPPQELLRPPTVSAPAVPAPAGREYRGENVIIRFPEPKQDASTDARR